MNIGIACYPTYGGSGAVATELGLELAKRGHEIHFITYAHPFRLPTFVERVYYHEVEMAEYPLFEHPPYCLALAVAMHDAARKHHLDLLHVHYAIPHATCAWLARQMLGDGKLKILTTLHGTDITLVGVHPSFRAITRFSILESDGLTAVSQYLKEATVADFGVPAERIHVVPNFVNTAEYRREGYPCRRDALAGPDEKILMHVSNFRPVKRVSDVVAIFARVREQLPARLIMVGDGPERPRAAECAERLRVADYVTFLGKHTSVAELLSCADLFLLPSQSESFGLAALEAMACGVPVVGTRVGGMPEVVSDERLGFLGDVGDLDSMTGAAVELLRDSRRWQEASATGRALAVERFSSEKVVPVYERLYAEVVGQAGVAR